MSQELRAAFLELRNQHFDVAVLHGTTSIPPVVFCGRQEQPLAPAWLYRIHRRVCPCQVCASIASTICDTHTRRSNSMSTMPPSNTCRSSWGMPASRLRGHLWASPPRD
jgi:hypothetical protein